MGVFNLQYDFEAHSRAGCLFSHTFYTTLYSTVCTLEPSRILSNTCNMIQSNDIHTMVWDGVSKFLSSLYVSVHLMYPEAQLATSSLLTDALYISYKYRPWLQHSLQLGNSLRKSSAQSQKIKTLANLETSICSISANTYKWHIIQQHMTT